MEPQTAIRNLMEILDDLENDGIFLTEELTEIRAAAQAIVSKIDKILGCV